MLVREKLHEGKWKFSIDGNSPHTENFRLLLDGTISGYFDVKTVKWLLRGQGLHFLDEEGCTTAILQDVSNSSKKQIWSGRDLNDGNRVYTLKRNIKKVRCFFRTHFWDAHIEAMYEQASKCWGSRPIIAADMTNPFDIPGNLTTLRHTHASLSSMGLAMVPENVNPLWYNGDYIFYDLLLKSDWDFAFILEYDLFINTPMQALAADLVADGVDFAAFNLDRSGPEWYWHNTQAAAFEAWNDFYETTQSTPSTPFGSLFPLIFVSREAAISLFAKRLEYNRIRKIRGDYMWSFCESFVPSELYRQNFKIKNISDYLTKKYHIHVTDAKNLAEARSMDCSFVHPVLSGERLIDKILTHATISLGGSETTAVDWLKKRDIALLHSDERSMYQSRLEDLMKIAGDLTASP